MKTQTFCLAIVDVIEAIWHSNPNEHNCNIEKNNNSIHSFDFNFLY